MLRYKGDGTLGVHTSFAEVPHDALKGLAESCKDGKLEKEQLAAMDDKRNREQLESSVG